MKKNFKISKKFFYEIFQTSKKTEMAISGSETLAKPIFFGLSLHLHM